MKKSPVSPAAPKSDAAPLSVVPTGPATGLLYVDGRSPVRVFGVDSIRKSFGEDTLRQAVNARLAPGVVDVVLNPDAHVGYGAPIGCVMVSPTHIYPGPVGVDINCSMSLLQFDLDANAIADKRLRRALVDAIERRVPTGAGYRQAPLGRKIPLETLERALVEGATPEICALLEVNPDWANRLEDAVRVGSDGSVESLAKRLDVVKRAGTVKNYEAKLAQLGSYGGGNHFGECEIVRFSDAEKRNPTVAQTFGLVDGGVAFLSHCGSRGFGNELARAQFATLQRKFETWGTPFPSGDKQLVYAPLGTPEANDYLDDITLGANFATLNHLVINSLVAEAFAEVLPGVAARFVYFVSHNFARREILDGAPVYVHRKGATRAYPANHFALKDTPFAATGHPILLPGNPTQGSSVMVALDGAKASCYSINHGAGRALGRREAVRTLDQKQIDAELAAADILTNCRQYPKDEAPAAYKDFNEVLRSVEEAGLAREVARLKAAFVIKDADKADD
ncbi:MAG: RtcB family protein [Thermoguttaceae bacterium]|nr:RtcB family protein [Thermoguttaceae bacterium]